MKAWCTSASGRSVRNTSSNFRLRRSTTCMLMFAGKPSQGTRSTPEMRNASPARRAIRRPRPPAMPVMRTFSPVSAPRRGRGPAASGRGAKWKSCAGSSVGRRAMKRAILVRRSGEQQPEGGETMLVAVAVVLALATPAAAVELDAGRLIDLTHPFDASTIYWPTARPFQLTPVAHGMTPGGYWYAASEFCAAEHGGTHMDAPVHFGEGHWTADQVPL